MIGWLRDVQVDGFSTSAVEVDGLTLRVPDLWDRDGAAPSWRGPVTGEGLVVRTAYVAGRDGDLAAWVQAPMALTGGLDPETLVDDLPAELRDWAGPEPVSVAGAEQAVVFSGSVLLRPPDARPELVRCYVVLVEGQDRAWKVGLTISSALLPGAPADQIDANDHARARACLGALTAGAQQAQ